VEQPKTNFSAHNVLNDKVKVQVPVYTKKAWGDYVKYHSFLALTPDTDEWSASDTNPFTTGNEPLVLNELDGTQSQSGCFGEEGS
jgi:hypothetical protein